jgi:cytochrome P450
LVQWYYSRILNSEIRRELDKEFEKYTTDRNYGSNSGASNRRQAKSVVNLALEAYIADYLGSESRTHEKLDDTFAQYAIYQIRIFLFAGNDTTASTLVWAYHMLFKHPDALTRIREEHDQVFGLDPSQATSMIRKNPALINQCSFTMAVIKETLRLYSPAASTRQGGPGIKLTDHDGTSYPLDVICANIDHPAMHFNSRFWPRADEFIPDRWLITDPKHELYPVSGAFRPFEVGPRSCLGQTLAINELRVSLIMTIREFDIQPAYEELDSLRERALASQWWPKKSTTINRVDGDRAYQTDTAGAHPSEGYPCRVTLRKT